jgi:hypothetical protein
MAIKMNAAARIIQVRPIAVAFFISASLAEDTGNNRKGIDEMIPEINP